MTDSLLLPVLYTLLGAGVYVWVALSLSAVFRKVGEEPWQAWVPILNTVVLLRLGGVSPWLILLNLVPFAGWIAFFVVSVIAYQRINRSFGLGVGFTVLAAVLFPVWTSILGWGSARWLRPDVSHVTGPVRRGASDVPLDVRPGPVAPSGPSVFGTHGPAGGPGVPPRPPAPVAQGFPSVVPPVPPVPSAVPASSAAAPAGPELAEPDARGAQTPIPAFRSTMRRAEAEAAVSAEDFAFASHTPYTQTFPIQSGDRLTSPPAGPIRAVPASPLDDEATEAPQSEKVTPVSAVPPAPRRSGNTEPWAPPVGAPPIAGFRATRLPAPDASEPGYYETSAEVSAVAGAPTLGAPRSARTSVSAQHTEPEIPDELEFEETIVASRRRTQWTLIPPLGVPIGVTGDILILGRRPNFDVDFADAQLIPISDETRTISKTHARLELHGDSWVIVDLDSTNGVILITPSGEEIDATPGVPERLTARFLLGDAELQLRREGE